MDGAADGYRRDLKIAASIFRTTVLDLYTPLAAGHGDFPSALRPPAIYVLAMYEDPKMRISRQMGRACNNTAFRNTISAIGGVNLNRAARTGICYPMSEGLETPHC
jgi:hypothetical protein